MSNVHRGNQRQVLNTFERIVTLFTPIRAGEGKAVALFFSYACLIIISYYIFKTLREPLIIGSASADAKAYATALAAVVLLLFMPVYSMMFRRCTRERLVMILALAFAAMGATFAGLYQMGVTISYPYYVWVSIYGVLMVTQFWVFATGSFNIKSGKRLFPVILIGASLGGLIGAQIASFVIGHMGIASGLLAASAIIATTSFFPYIARDAVPAESSCLDCHMYKNKNASLLGGLHVVGRSKLMILIAIYALLLNIVNSTGEYIFAETLLSKLEGLGITEIAERERYIGQTYAQFAFWVTAVALFMQMFVVSRVFIYFGISVAVMAMPVLLTIGYFLGGFFPVFTFIYALKALDNSLDYSLTNTVRQTLFLPVTHEEKFEAKTAIDTFLWRFGDLLQAGVIYAALNWLNWGIKEIAYFCGFLGIFWIITARSVAIEYKERLKLRGREAPKLNNPLDHIHVVPGEIFNLLIPKDVFVTADPSDCLRLSAKLASGDTLPEWLKLNSKGRLFSGLVPSNMKKTSVVLVASDVDGLTAENQFVLDPGSQS